MYELIRRWRRKAGQLNNLGEWPTITLQAAADEVERAWHDDNHGSAWNPNCEVCIDEMMRENAD